MPHGLENLQREVGLLFASHVWTTTVSSQTLIAAPSSGKAITIRYVACGQSAVTGLLRITANTTAGSNYFNYNQSGPHSEAALIPLADAEGAYLHMTAGGGNGFIRLYYSIRVTSGT